MSTDLDDFADLDFDDEVDEFADLDELAEDFYPTIDLTKPTCETCAGGLHIGGYDDKCHKCRRRIGWEAVEAEKEEKAEEARRKRAEKAKTPKPIMSGHCNTPQSDDPHISHERCAIKGAGSSANPDRRFHPCPCTCHLYHVPNATVAAKNPDGTFGDVLTYQCGGCTGVLAEAPVFGLDADGDPIYVHVDKRTHQMLYTGPCQ